MKTPIQKIVDNYINICKIENYINYVLTKRDYNGIVYISGPSDSFNVDILDLKSNRDLIKEYSLYCNEYLVASINKHLGLT